MSVEISRIKARQNLREQAREQASDAVFQALDVIPAPE